MPENREEDGSITQKLTRLSTSLDPPGALIVQTQTEQISHEEDQVSDQIPAVRQLPEMSAMEMPVLPSTPKAVYIKQVMPPKLKRINKRDAANSQLLQERCRQLSFSLFFREHASVRSLGFTSSIAGEGKSFLAMVTAGLLANDSSNPVTLVECNWAHSNLHEYFGLPALPGLAEWLRNECVEENIRYRLSHNLTLIPAGNGKQDAVKLLQRMRQKGLLQTFAPSNELLIVDLPPIVTTGYGALAASLVESLIVVLRAGVTPDFQVAETCRQIKDLPVEGMILNQVESRIPRWIQELLP